METSHSFGITLAPTLENLEFKGVVDWQGFEVTLPSPSQFRHLQDRTIAMWGKIFFEPVEGTEFKTWAFRLQNPPAPDQFMREVQSMLRPGDPPITEEHVRITGIEIALDAYHPTSDRQALARAVLHFIRHQAHPPSGQPRITGKGICFEPESPQDILDHLLRGAITVNSGKLGADRTCRFYLKDYDFLNGVPYAALPKGQWRARFENTLTGNEVPFKTIEGWRNFGYEALAKDLFALVAPSPTRSHLAALLQDRMIQLGRRPDSYRRRTSDRRKGGPCTRRDSDMNEGIRQALRGLTRAQSCRNSGNISAALTPPSLGTRVVQVCPPEYLIFNTTINRSVMASQSSLTQHLPESIPAHQRGPPKGPRLHHIDPTGRDKP